MLRMNIGIEHGNYDYRRNYLKRNVKDEVQIRAFEIAAVNINMPLVLTVSLVCQMKQEI